MYRYQIEIDVPGIGWTAALSFGSEVMRDRALAERRAKYPQTKYRPYPYK